MPSMLEYIRKPDWVNYEDLLGFSKNITSFILAMRINSFSNLIDLDYLREYYRLDKKGTLSLIDELALRGFTFSSNKKNSILPTIVLQEPIMCIAANVLNNDLYQNISFEKLGLKDFMDRFQVSSDGFFDKIPIQTFKYLSKSVNLELLEETFKNAGFKIHDIVSLDNDRTSCDIEKEFPNKETAIHSQYNSVKKKYTSNPQRNTKSYRNDEHIPKLNKVDLDELLSNLSTEELKNKSDEMEQNRKFNYAAQLVNTELVNRGIKEIQYYLRLAKCFAGRNLIDEAKEIYTEILLSIDRDNKVAQDYMEIYGKGLFYKYQDKPFSGVYRDIGSPPPETEVIIDNFERHNKASKQSQKNQ